MRNFYAIVAELENVAWKLYEDNPDLIEAEEGWVKEEAEKIMGREIDSMENTLLAAKLWTLMSNETEQM